MVRNKHNTPGITKYPFWQMTMKNSMAIYACVNYGDAYVPKEIAKHSICINAFPTGMMSVQFYNQKLRQMQEEMLKYTSKPITAVAAHIHWGHIASFLWKK